MSTHPLAWIDTETTGLNPNSNHLLEVACYITDEHLTLLDDSGIHFTVKYEPGDVERMKQQADPYVQDMHDATGLWGRLPSGTDLNTIDANLLTYIEKFAPTPRTVRVAGNSVRLDLNFLEAFLPSTYAHLHYRSVDVSTLTFLAQHMWGVEPMVKQATHSADDDIRESIAELRYLLDAMGAPTV